MLDLNLAITKREFDRVTDLVLYCSMSSINDIDEIFDGNTNDPFVLESTKMNCLIYADDLLLLSETKEGLLQSCP